MAKYVCDFAQVTEAGDKLCTMASDLESSITNYSTTIDSDLSSWNGEAKGSFSESCKSQIEVATQYAQQATALGEFIKNASSSIEKLESELASLNI